jgi:3-deoxy-D-manno-octulosonic-acid transferase
LGLLNVLALPAAAMVALSYLLSGRRGLLKNLADELGERLGEPAGLPKNALWVHAASAGEVRAVEPLLKRLEGPVFVTCTTALGRETARKLGYPAALAPLDFMPSVSSFLAITAPRALIVVETELWPTTLHLAKAAGLKLGLVNGRFSPERFWRYKLARPFLAPFVALFDALAVQSEPDAVRYLLMGARGSVRAVGNLKYDRPLPEPRSMNGEGPTLVAASTHPGEEEIVIEAFKRLPSEWRLVIAPRHVERAAQTRALLNDLGPRVMLIDTFGVLPSYFARATAAFVGGTLVPVGGHNVMEPVMAGTPVLFGPHTEHTKDAAELLVSAGCGFRVGGAGELAETLEQVRRRPELRERCLKLTQGLQGATARALEHLAPVVKVL